jgi:hypothetical protein
MTVRSGAYYSIASRRLQTRENLMGSQPKQGGHLPTEAPIPALPASGLRVSSMGAVLREFKAPARCGPDAGWCRRGGRRHPATPTRLGLGKVWARPNRRPIIEVHHLVAVNEHRVAWLVREIIEANSPARAADLRLEHDVSLTRCRAPRNGAPQLWMSQPVICGAERNAMHGLTIKVSRSGQIGGRGKSQQ